MATVAGCFMIPHIPLLGSIPTAPPADVAGKIWAAFETVVDRMRALDIDTIITIGDDHCINFSPACVPQCLVAIGDVYGPHEDWIGIERQQLATHEALARHILTSGQSSGVGWAFSKDMLVDHAVMIPHHFCYRHIDGVRVVPIYLNTTVDPVISGDMARRVGEALRAAIDSWPGSERVAVVGTGGLSHWVGMPEMGRVNPNFDQAVLEMVEMGDIDGLCLLGDDDVIELGGNGGLEIRNWIAALATMPGCSAEVIAYEPVEQWITGVAFAQARVGATGAC